MQTQQPSISQGTRYYSKIDAWIIVLICIILLFVVFTTFVTSGGDTSGAWVALFINILVIVGIAALFLAIAFPLYYEITSDAVIVHCGRRHQEIPLASIQHVFSTHSAQTSPALSLDRLQIDYIQNGHRGFVLISPKGKLQFLHDLATSAGDLEVRGEEVFRR